MVLLALSLMDREEEEEEDGGGGGGALAATASGTAELGRDVCDLGIVAVSVGWKDVALLAPAA